MIAYLTKREQRILFFCIVMVFIYAVHYWIIRPLHQYCLELETKISSTQKRIYKDLRAVHRSGLMKDKYAEYLAKFKQTVSDEEVMSKLITEIESVAGGLSLGIADLKPQKVKNTESLNYFSVSLKFSSDSKTLIQFLHALQGQAHLFYLKDVRIDRTSARKKNLLKTQLILSKIFIAQ